MTRHYCVLPISSLLHLTVIRWKMWSNVIVDVIILSKMKRLNLSILFLLPVLTEIDAVLDVTSKSSSIFVVNTLPICLHVKISVVTFVRLEDIVIHSCTNTYIPAYPHSYVHTIINTYNHMHTHNHMHIQSFVHTIIPTYIHMYKHWYVHTLISSYIHSYTISRYDSILLYGNRTSLTLRNALHWK